MDIYVGIDGTGWESWFANEADKQKLDTFGYMPVFNQGYVANRRIANTIKKVSKPDAAGERSFHESAGESPVGPKDTVNKGHPMRYMDIGQNPYYAKEFFNSSVYQFYRNWKGRHAFYKRGPELEGRSTTNRAEDGFKFIEEAIKYSKPGDYRIFLCGYSRGGFGVVQIAEMAQNAEIDIHGLLLFDAVNRTARDAVQSGINANYDQRSVAQIPENVKYCLHLRRDPKGESRKFMGNCSLRPKNASKTSFHLTPILGTHSALGGLPYPPGDHAKTDYIVEVGSGPTKVTYQHDANAAVTSRLLMRKFFEKISR